MSNNGFMSFAELCSLLLLPLSSKRLIGYCHHPAWWMTWTPNFVNTIAWEWGDVGFSNWSHRCIYFEGCRVGLVTVFFFYFFSSQLANFVVQLQLYVCITTVELSSNFCISFSVFSRWHQTCVSSSSRKTMSSRTPKGSGSSILDIERTTLSRSSIEPSWSDILFFLRVLLKGLTAPPALPRLVRLHIYKLRLGL